jgi:hypothetical protein
MADNIIEPKRQAAVGLAVPQRSGEFADDIGRQVRSGSPSGSPTSATDADDSLPAASDYASTRDGLPPLPRRISPNDGMSDDSGRQTD